MNKKRLSYCIMGCIMVGTSTDAFAQGSYITYNHDDTKMNQITVQEVGAGSLTPASYYEVLHSSYQSTAASKNKMSFRTMAGTAAFQQISDADSLKSSLKKRAEVEALNIADREVDLAWLAEGKKVENKMKAFETNINRILSAGGSMDDKKRWTEYFNIYSYAIQTTQSAYMPNAERKKQYLAIYEDVSRQNDSLLSFLIQLNNRKRSAALMSASMTRPSNTRTHATSAYSHWRDAAWQVNN